jgi:hypothetical protein
VQFFCSRDRNFTTISAPLNRLTSKEAIWKCGGWGGAPLNYLEAFNLQTQSLISKPIIDYPRKHRPFSLIVDASTGTGDINGGLGAMLCQTDEEGKERVIAYKSRQLLKQEKNYTPFQVKLEAMGWAMDY